MSIDSFINDCISEATNKQLQSQFLKEYSEAMEKHREEKKREQERLLNFTVKHGYKLRDMVQA